MMRFLLDTQVDGRFFSRGSHVKVLSAGDSCIVLPDPGAHTTMCAVPAKNLALLRLFRVVLVNHRVGLMDEQERWGLDADDVRSDIACSAPDCEVLELTEASS